MDIYFLLITNLSHFLSPFFSHLPRKDNISAEDLYYLVILSKLHGYELYRTKCLLRSNQMRNSKQLFKLRSVRALSTFDLGCDPGEFSLGAILEVSRLPASHCMEYSSGVEATLEAPLGPISLDWIIISSCDACCDVDRAVQV